MTVRTPHMSHPFRVVGGRPVEVEQDSQAEIQACVQAALSTRLGSRIEEPEYGLPDELFELLGSASPNIDAALAVIEQWEPRAEVLGSAEVEDLTKRVLIELQETGG